MLFRSTFFSLFVWFCFVSSPGGEWYRLRNWPVNWFLELDPLIALGTILTTGKLYRGLIWAVLTLVLTILIGRFFCGWVCPFGTIHHFFGFLGKLGRTTVEKISLSKYSKYQSVKYYLLAFMLGAIFIGYLTKTNDIVIGSLQTGLLDPIPFVYRSFNLLLLPFFDSFSQKIWHVSRYYTDVVLVGITFFSVEIGRASCRERV